MASCFPSGSADARAREESSSLAAPGDSSFNASERCTLRRFERGEGVLAGEDFWGEMDLARSSRRGGKVSKRKNSFEAHSVRQEPRRAPRANA